MLKLLLLIALLPVIVICGILLLGLVGTVVGIGAAILSLVLKLVFFILLPAWLVFVVIRWILTRA